MQCPDCRAKLSETDYRGILIDECVQCKGRWFDKDELRKAKDKTDHDLRWLDFDPFQEETEKFKTSSQGKRCPKCSKTMTSLTYENSRVVVEKCDTCKGIWLNHGEFEKIVKYLEKIILTKPASEYAKEALNEFLEIFTGPEGKISEIKDFFAVLKLLELRIAAENPDIVEASQKIYQRSPFK